VRYGYLTPVLFSLAACGGEAGPPAEGPVDSLGVRVVESTAPRWGEEEVWSVGESPILDLAESGSGAAHIFERARDALWLADGRIVVGDDGWLEVRFFSASGNHLSSVGRPGEGPGEFGRIQTLSPWRGDSVAVFDPMRDRVTILTPAGAFRTVPLSGRPNHPESILSLNGSAFIGLFSTRGLRPTEPGTFRVPYQVLRLDEHGVVLDSLATIGGHETYWAPTLSGPPLISRDGHLAARRGDVVFGSADDLGYERFTEGRGQTQSVRVPDFDLDLPTELVENVRAQALVGEHPPDIRRALETMELPSSRPAYSKLLIDVTGSVWARAYRVWGEPDGPRAWQVFDSEGGWLGEVTMPDRFTPTDIGEDAVLGVWLDSFDVHHVQVRSLGKPGKR